MPYSLLYSPQSGAADPKLVLDGQDGKLAWHDVEGLNRLCVRVSPSHLKQGCHKLFKAVFN